MVLNTFTVGIWKARPLGQFTGNDFMWKRRAAPYQSMEEERLLKVKRFYLWKQHKHKVRKMASERSI